MIGRLGRVVYIFCISFTIVCSLGLRASFDTVLYGAQRWFVDV